MNNRLDLQSALEEVLGSNHVYFQPPEDIKLEYPCIIYERDDVEVNPADDMKYQKMIRYELMYIDRNPDTNDFIEQILDKFKYCSYGRHFVSDNLNHETFSLYY